MSTAVYYSNHNLPVEDMHPSHTLPSLSQIMPINQQQGQQGQQTQAQPQGQSLVSNGEQISPTFVNVPMNHGGYLGANADQKFVYQTQASPDVFSQSGGSSQPSSANTTPASSLSMGSQYSGASASAGTEKCTCKTNTNRIPRPRNAFILFRQKNHQLVLEEGSVIRTNPDVSRELGRRWRSLSATDKAHWNKLAEEEKVAHAKKYPGYKYTPRRNGKNKGCPACRQKSLKQQQVQLHNQQMYQLQQGQYQQYMQMQQQASATAGLQTPIPQSITSSNPAGQPLVNVPLTQFIVQPNPCPQQNFQFAFNNDMNVMNQQQLHQQLQQDKASPLSGIPSHQTGIPISLNNNSEFLNPVAASQMQINYDQNQPARFNSLPTPMGSSYGFEFGNMHQQQ